MTTSYGIQDTLPKDLGGAKFTAYIDGSTSQNDFSLPRGIGAEGIGSGSVRLSHLAVASHTVGSKLHTPGMLMMGAYIEAPSTIGTNNAQRIRSDKEGAMYTRGASARYSFSIGASTQTHVTGSALLHGYSISTSAVNLGAMVRISDGTGHVLSVIYDGTSKTYIQTFPQGIYFATSIRTTRADLAGAASVTMLYSQY